MNRDEQFTAWAEESMDMIFRVAFNYLKSRADAEDVTQDVLVKLYQRQAPFESDAHRKHWLLRVTINCCKKRLLSPWRKTEPLEDYAETLSFSTPEHSQLFYLIMELPRKYRLAIYLYYYEEYSTAEIGELLHIPQATVATHLFRGRELLRKKLTEAKQHDE